MIVVAEPDAQQRRPGRSHRQASNPVATGWCPRLDTSPRSVTAARFAHGFASRMRNRIVSRVVSSGAGITRLAIHNLPLSELAAEFKFATTEQLYQAIGEGEITIASHRLIQRRTQPQDLPSIVRDARLRRPGNPRHHGRRW